MFRNTSVGGKSTTITHYRSHRGEFTYVNTFLLLLLISSQYYLLLFHTFWFESWFMLQMPLHPVVLLCDVIQMS